MSNQPVITEARIIPAASMSDLLSGRADMLSGGQAHVMAKLGNDTEVEVFAYYSDELRFSAREFVGLTLEQARNLFTQRDIAYLRS